jgi:hypothetical protein
MLDSGTVAGIFVLGAAVGALLESIVRQANSDRIHRRFVQKLKDEEERNRVKVK